MASFHRLVNLPDNPDLAIETGGRLCRDILEPLQQTFGRVAIRSGYRSAAVNALCNRLYGNCASNEKNYARHIWDIRAADGSSGAMACIVLPWLVDRCSEGMDWREIAWWMHDNLPCSGLQFFPRLMAFNIGWREIPDRRIFSFVRPRGFLQRDQPSDQYDIGKGC